MIATSNNDIKIEPQIEESWKEVLQQEFEAEYFVEIKKFLLDEKRNGKTIYPNGKDIFSAFNLTPFNEVKVVILGQDPYHGPNQAHGLCFSVQDGIKPPPSLINIFKELHSDLNLPIPSHGNLCNWAKQGVFLLNAILTVQAHQPASHQKRGWENFTDAVIRAISKNRTNVVFILWGSFAQSKEPLIDAGKHFIIKAPHPSPFSADRGFFGSRPFSKTNAYLEAHEISPIDWRL